jgi:hypothetical protein
MSLVRMATTPSCQLFHVLEYLWRWMEIDGFWCHCRNHKLVAELLRQPGKPHSKFLGARWGSRIAPLLSLQEHLCKQIFSRTK